MNAADVAGAACIASSFRAFTWLLKLSGTADLDRANADAAPGAVGSGVVGGYIVGTFCHLFSFPPNMLLNNLFESTIVFIFINSP